MIDTEFTESQSGLFAKSSYNPEAETLVVAFRDGGRYAVPGVDADLHQQWLDAPKKSTFWHSVLKAKGPAKVG